jgi:hypothetical protein
MSLKQLQQDFIAFITSGENALAQRVVDQGQVSTATRLHIYSNAYRMRLREAIDNDHPILGMYLGDDLFDQMVAGYIDQNPSTTYSLRYFADQLPAFLQVAPPFYEYPLIAELARFERALLDAFDAPDSASITLAHLQQRPPESWPGMRFRFHPSVQRFDCQWNTVETWQALKKELAPPAPTKQIDCCWLLWRNQDRLTEFLSLPLWHQALLNAALAGEDFAGLCELLLQFVSEEEVSPLALQTISQWIDSGIIIRLD